MGSPYIETCRAVRRYRIVKRVLKSRLTCSANDSRLGMEFWRVKPIRASKIHIAVPINAHCNPIGAYFANVLNNHCGIITYITGTFEEHKRVLTIRIQCILGICRLNWYPAKVIGIASVQTQWAIELPKATIVIRIIIQIRKSYSLQNRPHTHRIPNQTCRNNYHAVISYGIDGLPHIREFTTYMRRKQINIGPIGICLNYRIDRMEKSVKWL